MHALSLKHRIGKEKYKIEIGLTIVELVGLEKETEGCSVWVEWRRGTKKHTGKTNHIVVKGGNAKFEEKFQFSSVFYQDSKGKYDEKEITFRIKEENPKKKKANKIGQTHSGFVNLCRSH